jgi:hypothetical protein
MKRKKPRIENNSAAALFRAGATPPCANQ